MWLLILLLLNILFDALLDASCATSFEIELALLGVLLGLLDNLAFLRVQLLLALPLPLCNCRLDPLPCHGWLGLGLRRVFALLVGDVMTASTSKQTEKYGS